MMITCIKKSVPVPDDIKASTNEGDRLLVVDCVVGVKILSQNIHSS